MPARGALTNMIRVLQDWNEIGRFIVELRRLHLPQFPLAEKNWDQWLFYQMIAGLDRNTAIADLGCGGGATLSFLQQSGFRNFRGIDLHTPTGLRRVKFALVNHQRLTLPYRMDRGDLTDTCYPACAFGAACCLSTIEHGVAPDRFFREARRILRPGAPLLLTTDYWEDKIAVDATAFNLPWRIFSKAEIEELIRIGAAEGFALTEPGAIPPCAGRPIHWLERDYTFIALQFRKAGE